MSRCVRECKGAARGLCGDTVALEQGRVWDWRLYATGAARRQRRTKYALNATDAREKGDEEEHKVQPGTDIARVDNVRHRSDGKASDECSFQPYARVASEHVVNLLLADRHELLREPAFQGMTFSIQHVGTCDTTIDVWKFGKLDPPILELPRRWLC